MRNVSVVATTTVVAAATAFLFSLTTTTTTTTCHAFVVPPPPSPTHPHPPRKQYHQHHQQQSLPSSSSSLSRLNVVLDPFVLDAGIAVVSAAAGAATQFPRIRQLERDVKSAREALTASELELVSKINQLEDKLFQMDSEYEQATTKFKKQYDTRMKQDLERMTEKMKVDFQYKLEIRLQEQKSKMLLQDKLDLVNKVTGGNRQEELVELRVRNSRVQRANQELEQALEASKRELEKLQHGGAKSSGWWPF